MKIVLLFTGRTTGKYLEAGIADFAARIRRMTGFDIVTVPAIRNSAGMQVEEIKKKEGTQILRYIAREDYLVLLDEKGEQHSSNDFAGELQRMMMKPVKRIVFLTGGAWGVSEDIYKRADRRLSISKMTFSHQVVRLAFAEQLYRALTILKGLPYHHP